MFNVYIVFADETGNSDCSRRLRASEHLCVGMVALRNEEAVALSSCMAQLPCDLAWSSLALDSRFHATRNKQVVPLFVRISDHWSIFDPTPRKRQEPAYNETSPSRRWAYIMLGVRYGMALLAIIWTLLPDDLRNLLVSALSR